VELTLDQALKNGCTQKEEMFYRTLQTILEAHPAHPDANYHMGLLAVDANKISEALLFFKTALEMNPRMGQFWLSYIDTLIKLDRITEAKFMFDQAKDQGAIGELFDQLEKQLSDSSVYPQALLPDKLDPIESLYIQDQQDQASPKILETLFDLRR
jgi:tetratricopeptide (TPR) repeat protein